MRRRGFCDIVMMLCTSIMVDVHFHVAKGKTCAGCFVDASREDLHTTSERQDPRGRLQTLRKGIYIEELRRSI